MAFPFEEVYEHFAKIIIDGGLGPEQLEPMLVLVQIKDGKPVYSQLPDQGFFANEAGKRRLSQAIQSVLYIADQMKSEAAVVMIAEAFMAFKDLKGRSPDDVLSDHYKEHESLSEDPDSVEVVMVNIIHKDDTKLGHLLINADRTVTYQPMEKRMQVHGGRFSNKPD